MIATKIMIIILIPSKPFERMRNNIPAKITCSRIRIQSLASPGGIMTFTTHNSPVNRISTTEIQESETAIEAIATESIAATTSDI